MSDWATVASAGIAGGSAILGAALGYATARQQANLELRRVRHAQGEEHRRERQAAYEALLASAHRFHQSNSIEPWSSPDEVTEWARSFESCLVRAELLASDAVRTAIKRLGNAVTAAFDDVAYDGPIEDEFLAAWDACTAAMRKDVTPS